MSEIQLAHFSWGETPGRSRIHDVAVREATIATEARGSREPSAERIGIVERLGLGRIRLALAGGPAMTADSCTCPA